MRRLLSPPALSLGLTIVASLEHAPHPTAPVAHLQRQRRSACPGHLCKGPVAALALTSRSARRRPAPPGACCAGHAPITHHGAPIGAVLTSDQPGTADGPSRGLWVAIMPGYHRSQCASPQCVLATIRCARAHNFCLACSACPVSEPPSPAQGQQRHGLRPQVHGSSRPMSQRPVQPPPASLCAQASGVRGACTAHAQGPHSPVEGHPHPAP